MRVAGPGIPPRAPRTPAPLATSNSVLVLGLELIDGRPTPVVDQYDGVSIGEYDRPGEYVGVVYEAIRPNWGVEGKRERVQLECGCGPGRICREHSSETWALTCWERVKNGWGWNDREDENAEAAEAEAKADTLPAGQPIVFGVVRAYLPDFDAEDPVDRAVARLLDDLWRRGGFANVWDALDVRIRREILASWRSILRRECR